MKLKPGLIALSMALSGMALAATPDAELTNTMAHQLNVQYDVIANGLDAAKCAPLGADWASCYSVDVTLTNTGAAINGKDWEIYFSSIRRVLKVDTDQFKITHLTGDLYRLQPTEKFNGFGANAAIKIPLVLEYWQISTYDTMPRWMVKAGNADAKVIANTNTEDINSFVGPLGKNWQRTATDANVLMNASSRFEQYSQTPALPQAAIAGRMIPEPMQQTMTGGNITIANGLELKATGLTASNVEALQARFRMLGVAPKSGNLPAKVAPLPVRVSVQPDAVPEAARKTEGYSLTITPQGVTVTGYDAAGAFNGVQSLLSLVNVQGPTVVPAMQVVDAPRFNYRAFMIDVARNFHSKAMVLKAIDQMAAYKLNKLHFHLSDDEGWRLQIPGLPQLTDVGGKRCLDLSETKCLLPQLGAGPDTSTNGSGYFTRAEFIEILKYAHARNIEVIPEIDMPAHSRAAVVSMEARYKELSAQGKTAEANEYRLVDPQDTSNITTVQYYNRLSTLNPCLPSTLKFTDKVIGEVAKMYKDAGLKMNTWHFGADEAKNIFLGGGYADKNAKDNAGKGQMDMSLQDHPWGKSPVCQALVKSGKVDSMEHLPSYYAHQVNGLLPKYGVTNFQAWQDGLKKAPNAKEFPVTPRVNFWDTLFWGGADTASEMSAKGFAQIISSPDYVYLDFPNEVDPNERGYYWGARSNTLKKIFTFAPENLPQNAETSLDRDGKAFEVKSADVAPNVIGLSAQVWSESFRTDQQYEYMAFPRLIAVAERAWHKASWELPYQSGAVFKSGVTHNVDAQAIANDYTGFANALGQRELAKLDRAGVDYRLSMVGAKVVNGKLAAVTELPGVHIQYSLDAGKTWQAWNAANAPAVADPQAVQVRSVSTDGKRFGRASGL
ncbi:family 20 glycosylhydrolase [Silvimonas sp.]|uniref:family 20 glycosylhydrolase n=1 Tax=Silvimonas sp. TaxID=2650811 RepID=UPI002848A8C5|nr:family 20 glycosylhydrolase [Silvimonas sp.]MDR3426584.1 family 20 glycosylhydrolase [Silvimonas sp.]